MLSERDKEEILKWYEDEGRRFPWRKLSLSPYKTLVTEFLLQRTRAETVAEMWSDFFDKHPDIESLNEAEEEEVSSDLEELGFHNRRARDLKKTAGNLIENNEGQIPENEESLLELPGVGLYIANATLCFGFDQKRPIVDTNVKKVFEYLFDLEIEDDLRKDDEIWGMAARNLPDQDFKKFNWALLDLGAQMSNDKPEVLMRIKKVN